jgi:hypothetical protein
MALAFPLVVFLALLLHVLKATAIPDPRYLNFYGRVMHGPPVQSRTLPTLQTFDPNAVCTLASQYYSSLTEYDFAFCCKEDSPFLDFWFGVSFQTCKLASSNPRTSTIDFPNYSFKHVLTLTGNASLATNRSSLCPQSQKFTCCTSDVHTIKRTCNLPRQNDTGPVKCTYHDDVSGGVVLKSLHGRHILRRRP